MKRDRDDREVESMAMANCLMLLSRIGKPDDPKKFPGRTFACKTCNREFPSFQALGGHRASHKKPKMLAGDLFTSSPSPPKPKTHVCSICGLEFPIGQALGGHMRRHRGGETGQGMDLMSGLAIREASLVPVLKKSNSNKRVTCLDLNLPPFEDELTLELGKVKTTSSMLGLVL
ncbi:hypothetical protein MLD38_011602 [Melastoma candidum]|uniref:Uncharacterized protein n=1 Tax=Melastoma candidum TaxID=119954 RepID=A0ACB9R3L8_9MYRT|nr:hypothetical protein MLD38_011602 [Melastoma candidum]